MKKIITLAALIACPVVFSADIGTKAASAGIPVFTDAKEAARSLSVVGANAGKDVYKNGKGLAKWTAEHPYAATGFTAVIAFTLKYLLGGSTAASSSSSTGQ